jgi:hypothetical protein
MTNEIMIAGPAHWAAARPVTGADDAADSKQNEV